MIRVTVVVPKELVSEYSVLAAYKGVGLGYYMAEVIGKYGPDPDEEILEKCIELSEDQEIHYLSEIVEPARGKRVPSTYSNISYYKVTLMSDCSDETARGMAVLATLADKMSFSRAATMILAKYLDSEISRFRATMPRVAQLVVGE